MSAPDPHQPRSDDAAAYVLGALEEHEAAEFRAHLATCEQCAAEVDRLGAAAAALPLGVIQLNVPTGLKREVMRAVARDAGQERTASPRVSRTPRPWRAAFSRAALSGGVAFAAAVTLGVLVLVPGGGGSLVIHARVANASAWPALAKPVALLRRSGNHAELVVTNLPLTPTGKVYELWIERHDVPIPTDALFEPNSDGRASVDVPGSLAGANAVLVTIERAGGATVPSMAPLIDAQLST